jgi:hypothetical protein
MSYQSTILSQVLKEVNKYDFKNQVSKNNGDHKVQFFSCYDLLVTMIYSQIKKKDSTRNIITGLSSITNDLYHHGISEVRRTTLSNSLNSRPSKVFEDYFYSLLSEMPRKEKRKFKRKVNILDSTTISFCLSKFNWAKYKSTKGGIKLHTIIDFDSLIPEKVLISNAKVHDIKGVNKKIRFNPGEIYVKDRGYASYKYLYRIELAKSYFVTRIKDNWKIIRTDSRDVNIEKGILLDEYIEVDGNKKSEYKKKLRMITFYHSESKKIFRFITNNFEMTSEEIAEIYKSRWQIELFFKWLKQHLNIKSFYSTSENGVKTQIWCALITYLLLMKIKLQANLEISIYDILRKLTDFIDKRIDMFDLLFDRYKKYIPAQNNVNSGQLLLNFI